MSPYRNLTSPRSAVVRSRAQVRAHVVRVVILALASVGLCTVAVLGWTADSFLAAFGGLLCGCGAVGMLVSRVIRGVGTAHCPACGAPVHDVERAERVEGLLCGHCGSFLHGEAGELGLVDEGRVADEPIFGAGVTQGFAWPEGCAVCGAPVTQTLPVRISKVDEEGLALSAAGLALAAATGVGFVVLGGQRVGVQVPHCDEHDDGALLVEGGPTGFVLFFRAHRYQRAFCALNRAPTLESPATGRRGAGTAWARYRDSSPPAAAGPRTDAEPTDDA